jgi:hypothetical protein
MTRIPKCADLILNKVSAAPGFWIGNVIVMAGVPSICSRSSPENLCDDGPGMTFQFTVSAHGQGA